MSLLVDEHARAARLYQAAELWQKRASQTKQATRCYEAALECDTRHQGALDALEAIYGQVGDVESLTRVLRLKIERAANQPAQQTALLGRLAETLLASGDDDGARAVYHQALEADARYVPALIFFARGAAAREDRERARRHYEAALEALARVDVELGSVAGVSGRTGALLECRVALAEICRAAGDPDGEEQHLVQARRIVPDDARVLERLEALYEEQNRGADHVDLLAWRAARARDPREQRLLARRHAAMLYRVGRAKEAADIYERLVAEHPGERGVLEELARALRRTQRLPRLLEVLEQLVGLLDIESRAAREQRDTTPEGLERAERAEGEAEPEAELDTPDFDDTPTGPPPPPSSSSRAKAEEATQAADAAVAVLVEAAQLALRLELPDRARQHLESALARRPDNIPALDSYAAMLRADGSSAAFERLEPILARRIARERHQVRRIALTIEHAELCERRGDLAKTAQVLDAAIDADDHDGELLLLSARVNEQLERWGQAARAYELLRTTAIRPAEEKHAIRQLLRLVSGPLQSKRQLVSLCQRLLELSPDDREALETLAGAYEERGEHGEAAEVLEQLLDLLERHYGRVGDQLEVTARLAHALRRADRSAELPSVLAPALRKAGSDRRHLERLAQLMSKLSGRDESAPPMVAAAAEALRALELATRRQLAQTRGGTMELLRVAELERSMGRPSEAAEALHEALTRLPPGPTRADVARDLLRSIDSEADADAALVALGVLEQEDASDDERWRLARLLSERGKPAQALTLVSRIDPRNVASGELKSLRWQLLERTGNELELAREIEADARAHAEAQARARGLLDAGRQWLDRVRSTTDAVRCVGDAARAVPDDIASLERAAHELISAGAGDMALELTQRLCSDERTFSPVQRAAMCCMEARLRRDLGDAWENVRAAYERALEHDAHSAPALEGLIALSREQADRAGLAAALARRAHAGGGDASSRHGALIEAASLYARDLAQPQDARPLLDEARRLAPDDEPTLQLLAEVSLATGESETTEQVLVALADLGRDPERNLARACGLARLRGDRAAETRYLARLGDLRPESAQIKRRLANVYRDAGDLDGLRRQLEQLADEDNQALFELARLHAGPLDDPLAAHDAFARLIARDQQHRAAREELAQVCRELGFYRDVAEQLRALVDLEPPEAKGRRGELLFELAAVCRDDLADEARAATALRDAMQCFGSGQRWADATRDLLSFGQDVVSEHEARALRYELCRLGLADRDELEALARDAEQAGDLERAEMALRRLDELSAADEGEEAARAGGEYLERLVDVVRRRETPGELAELLERLAARRESIAAGQLLLEAAEQYRAAALSARAEGALRRAAQIAPDDADIADRLLSFLQEKGDRVQLADALESAAARARDERRIALLEQLAEVAESLGQSGRAADAREQIVTAAPGRAHLLPELLERALRERDRERAQRLLDTARAGSPDDALLMLVARATTRLAALELEAEQPRRAAELCEQALAIAPDSRATLELKRTVAERLGDNRAAGDALLALAEMGDGKKQRDLLREAAAALRLVPDAREECVDVHRRLCELDPDDHESRQALERLLRESDDPAQLVAFLWRSVGERAGEARVAQLLEIARIEQALGRPTWAERAYREALAENPRDARALRGLAANLQQHEQWQPLVELLQTALDESDLEPDPRAELATMLGQTYFDQLDEPDRGAAWLQVACECSPRAEQAFRRLLEHRRSRGEYREAARLIERTVRARKDDSAAGLWEELGHLLEVRLHDTVGAARAYQSAFEAAPEAQLARGVRAHELWADAERPEEALEVLGHVLPRVSAEERPALELSRARLLRALGRADEARRALDRLLEQGPAGQLEAHAEAELGELLRDAGDNHAALPHLVVAADRLAEATRAARAAVAAGEVLEALGLSADARERFEQALALDPALAAAHQGVARQARVMSDHDRLASALQVLATLSDSAEERAGYLLERAALARAGGHNETALSAYQRAFEVLDPTPAALEAARRVAMELGRYDTAAELCARAIRAAEEVSVRARLSRELGLIYADKLDDPSAAAHHLEAALQLDADDDRAAEALLPLLEKTRRHGEAGRLAQRLASRRKGDARRALEVRAAKAYEAAGWTDEARHLYRQLSSGDDDSAREATTRLIATEARGASDSSPAIEAGRAQRHTPPPVSLAAKELAGHAPDDGASSRSSDGSSGLLEIADIADPELDTLARHGDFEGLAAALRERARDVRDTKHRAALLLRLGHVLEELLERPYEALEIYAEAAIAAPRSAAVLAALADAAYRHQDWQRARATYERLWQMDAGSGLGRDSRVELAYRRGVVHEALGAYDAADLCYSQALDLDEKYRPALETRARLALFRDDFEGATQMLTRLSRLISVDDVDALIEVRERLGELHLRLGNLYTAREYLDAALALDAHRTKAMQLMLATQEQLGRYDEAVELLQQLVYRSTDPLVRASLLHHRAELLGSHLGDEEAAIDCLLRAYDIAPNHVPTLWRLVDYYWSQDDLDAVVEIGEELAKSRAFSHTTPDRRHTRIAAAMQLARGRREAAEKLLGSALSDEALVEPSLLDLAHAVSRGADESSLAKLVFAADQQGHARRSAQRILRDNPSQPGLGRLVDAILNAQ
ncbi:MAG: hypothetical protein KC503_44070 [Myxococcales bacterium]|nr:hypothetical protein [Myxococcales bacterium]